MAKNKKKINKYIKNKDKSVLAFAKAFEVDCEGLRSERAILQLLVEICRAGAPGEKMISSLKSVMSCEPSQSLASFTASSTSAVEFVRS